MTRRHSRFRRLVAALSIAALAATSSPALFAEQNPRFAKAVEHLDLGGEYFYFRDLKGDLSGLLEKANRTLVDVPGAPFFVGIARVALQELDLLGVEACGSSVVDLGGGRRRAKSLLLNPGERRGLFLALGGAPRASEALRYAPEETLLFQSEEVDGQALMELVDQVAASVAGPAGQQAVANAFEQSRQATGGFDLRGVVERIRGEVAMIQWINKEWDAGKLATQTEADPRDGGIAVLVSTTDPELFDYFVELYELPLADSGVDGVAMALLPEKPDFPPNAVLARDGDFLILSSSVEWLRRVVATSRGEAPRLSDTSAFQAATANLPFDAANGWGFVGADLWKLMKGAYAAGREQAAKTEPGAVIALKLVEAVATGEGDSARVRVNLEGGILTISEGKPIPAIEALSGSGIIAIPVLVAIAVPGFLRARDASRTRAIQADLARIDDANLQYAIEHNLRAGDKPPSIQTLVDEGYLRAVPVPPVPGEYKQAAKIAGPGMSTDPACYPRYAGPEARPDRVHPDLLPNQ